MIKYRLVILVVLFTPLDSLACSYISGWFLPSFDREIYEPGIPPVFEFGVESIRRGRGPTPKGNGSFHGSSCDDIGILEIKVESNSDVDPCEYGFYIYDLNSSAPEGLIPRNPIGARRSAGACILRLYWLDGATWAQDELKMELEFEAVNHFLFKGDRSSKLEVFHDGNQTP